MFRGKVPRPIKIFGLRIPKIYFYTGAVAGTIGFVFFSKEYMGGERLQASIMADGKVVIVTGANTGIGQATAMELAKRKAKVYMACRDLQKCEKAREEIVLETRNRYVYCRKCDLASLQSVRDFVSTFKREEKQLHVLINNAGVMRTPNSRTQDGFEMQLGVNHLGHFLLTNLLLDTLKSSAPSRVLNISSVAHKRGKINKDDLNSDREYDPAAAYAQSKLANLLFTRELAKNLKGSGVTAYAIHPGIVDSDIMRHMSFYNSWLATLFIKPFVWPFIQSPRQGAHTPVYVALSELIVNDTGKYFSNCAKAETSPEAKDDVTAAWLWKVSEKWTKLDAADTQKAVS